MAYHCRLYQHVHLDHGGVPATGVTGLRELERWHKALHDRGVFENCDPHELGEIPARTWHRAILEEAGRI